MYWLCGVPRVYAHRIQEEEIGNGENVEEKKHESDSKQVRDQHDVNGARERCDRNDAEIILDIRVARSDHLFTTITRGTLELWSLRPPAVLTSLTRSSKSLTGFGENLSVSFRSDSGLIVLRTTFGFLLIYSLESDSTGRVLQQRVEYSQSRKQSVLKTFGVNDAIGLGEVILKFKRAIKIDAGINVVLSVDQELIIATKKPAAIQCIKWDPQKTGSQASTQLVSKMDWKVQKSSITVMVHDRAMNISVWIDNEGAAYAVRRNKSQSLQTASSNDSLKSPTSSTPPHKLFDGFCFHSPSVTRSTASLAAVNARFSLIVLAVNTSEAVCYVAKDYTGNIPVSHSFTAPASSSTTGKITCLSWSPDGYCLFAGYEKGWATWSVFGKEGASSFTSNVSHSENNDEKWLTSVKSANWISGGAEILLTSHNDARIWILELSRSAAVGCFSCANLLRALQQTPTELAIYRGHEISDLISISNAASLWHHTQYPASYLHNQWPIRSCVVSPDGRYIAVAGRRGLVHYSIQSGRWKVFADYATENSFAVRGGMCWFNHILVVATEHAGGYDLRVYSRDQDLGKSPLRSEGFSMPVAFIGPSGEDSLLVYTYENILYHYVIDVTPQGAQLMQVGQIAFHGVVRAPSRVRSVSWILPDHQMRNGDPSRDVEHATVLFLVDDKLVLLQPKRTPEDGIKYDMRVIAHHVEYYILMRDQIYFNFDDPIGESAPPTPSPGSIFGSNRSGVHYSLRDSLWIFAGNDLKMWPDVKDVLSNSSGDLTTKAPLLSVPVDFYPLSILLNKGMVLGMESELLQRRDTNFAQFRTLIRTQLFLPYALKHYLVEVGDTSAAFALANQYQYLSYFPHALEILLHHVLDSEVNRDTKSKSADHSKPEPLPAVLSFLQMVLPTSTYLSTIVQCIRKTEASFWRYLFAHLPSPSALFEQALSLNDLKTASGYLLVFQGLDNGDFLDEIEDTANRRQFEDQVVRLMSLARQRKDFELCSELARFMIGIDPRGDALRRIIQRTGLRGKSSNLELPGTPLSASPGPDWPADIGNVENKREWRTPRLQRLIVDQPSSVGVESTSAISRSSAGDYFSASPGGR